MIAYNILNDADTELSVDGEVPEQLRRVYDLFGVETRST